MQANETPALGAATLFITYTHINATGHGDSYNIGMGQAHNLSICIFHDCKGLGNFDHITIMFTNRTHAGHTSINISIRYI